MARLEKEEVERRLSEWEKLSEVEVGLHWESGVFVLNPRGLAWMDVGYKVRGHGLLALDVCLAPLMLCMCAHSHVRCHHNSDGNSLKASGQERCIFPPKSGVRKFKSQIKRIRAE